MIWQADVVVFALTLAFLIAALGSLIWWIWSIEKNRMALQAKVFLTFVVGFMMFVVLGTILTRLL